MFSTGLRLSVKEEDCKHLFISPVLGYRSKRIIMNILLLTVSRLSFKEKHCFCLHCFTLLLYRAATDNETMYVFLLSPGGYVDG